MKVLAWLGLASLALALGLGAGSASAVPALRLSDGTTTLTCEDGAACDLNTAAGAVTFVGRIGAFTTNVATGVGRQGSPTPQSLSLSGANTSTSAARLVLQATDTGYTYAGNLQGVWSGTLTGTASATAAAYASTSNLPFATELLLGSLGPGLPGGSFAAAAPAAARYSLTTTVVLQALGAASYTGHLVLAPAVPEPGALWLATAGLLAMAALQRRRRYPALWVWDCRKGGTSAPGESMAYGRAPDKSRERLPAIPQTRHRCGAN